ncbi:MAG: hypothetical protein IJP84_09200 [Lachnospiraceae bacterium]|nr:hypothetical protein [Lachnospiraceae bacterium]
MNKDKLWDLRINSHGNAEPMTDGFFAHIDGSSFNEDNYIIIGNYRIEKHSYNDMPRHREAIDKFLKRNKVTDAQKRAQKKYDEAHKDQWRMVHLKLNKEKDKAIIEKLESSGNIQGYIKNLIMQDLKGGN